MNDLAVANDVMSGKLSFGFSCIGWEFLKAVKNENGEREICSLTIDSGGRIVYTKYQELDDEALNVANLFENTSVEYVLRKDTKVYSNQE